MAKNLFWTRTTEKDGGKPRTVSGTMDLVFKEKDGWVIADYKTDKVNPSATQYKMFGVFPEPFGGLTALSSIEGFNRFPSTLLRGAQDTRSVQAVGWIRPDVGHFHVSGIPETWKCGSVGLHSRSTPEATFTKRDSAAMTLRPSLGCLSRYRLRLPSLS